jgi:hypothetical protein
MTRKDEIRTISKIAQRAVVLAEQHGVEYKQIDAMIDLEAAHGEHALRLSDLLAADDGNFCHDVFGIRRHLNRETKKMGDCFLPRFTA